MTMQAGCHALGLFVNYWKTVALNQQQELHETVQGAEQGNASNIASLVGLGFG